MEIMLKNTKESRFCDPLCILQTIFRVWAVYWINTLSFVNHSNEITSMLKRYCKMIYRRMTDKLMNLVYDLADAKFKNHLDCIIGHYAFFHIRGLTFEKWQRY